MTPKEEKLKSFLDSLLEAERILKSKGILEFDSNSIWKILQFRFECRDNPTELLFLNLNGEEISKIVLEIRNPNCFLGTITFENPELHINGGGNALQKGKVKFNGVIWYLYRYDKDKFPSDPHAHNYEDNSKLHLGNGCIFSGKSEISKLSKKQLDRFRLILQTKMPWLELPVR